MHARRGRVGRAGAGGCGGVGVLRRSGGMGGGEDSGDAVGEREFVEQGEGGG